LGAKETPKANSTEKKKKKKEKKFEHRGRLIMVFTSV